MGEVYENTHFFAGFISHQLGEILTFVNGQMSLIGADQKISLSAIIASMIVSGNLASKPDVARSFSTAVF